LTPALCLRALLILARAGTALADGTAGQAVSLSALTHGPVSSTLAAAALLLAVKAEAAVTTEDATIGPLCAAAVRAEATTAAVGGIQIPSLPEAALVRKAVLILLSALRFELPADSFTGISSTTDMGALIREVAAACVVGELGEAADFVSAIASRAASLLVDGLASSASATPSTPSPVPPRTWPPLKLFVPRRPLLLAPV
jgi:hypothetical protein